MPLTGFHPTVRQWFAERLGEPTPPQRDGWPHIRAGRHTLIAAPTGSGKTLAAFLWAIDDLLRSGPDLPDETRVLYVSPLKALSNDVHKNLQAPLQEIRRLNIFLPEIRVLVRTGDTPARERAAMSRKPPHILVTTPESLYLLLTSGSGRRMLRTVRTVIVDEIHALARDKRGAHLALSLERLEALAARERAPRAACLPVQDAPGTGGQAASGTQALGGQGLGGRASTRRAAPVMGPDRAMTGPARIAETVPPAEPDPSAEGNAPVPTAFQRIGLSATQKPIEDIARFLVGVGRECTIVDSGHRRLLDVAVEIPDSPLTAVCSTEQWGEIYQRMAELIVQHRTTLVFVNTRKLAERIAARLTERLGEDQVTCHHGSLSRARRLDAEQRLKHGKLRALVATASLELGIDIGDVDLAIQIGSARAIATFLQRVGRAGHGVGRIPKGRLFPLTLDELVEAAAVLRAVFKGELDRTSQPRAPLDILAQQVVAACVPEAWDEQVLFETYQRAWPYRDVTRPDFDAVADLHTQGRRGLLHRDGVNGRLLAKRRARITAVTCGGAIPDTADYQVLAEPDGTFVGLLNEDFAVESNVGDIFQLGNTSWRVLRIEQGRVRVADAKGQPPTVPFWLGEAPARTAELSAEVGEVREHGEDQEWLMRECGLSEGAARQIADYIADGRRVLGAVPTQRRLIAERFFDESGGMQMVIHAPLGGRINRAWGLALRKRFCRGFGFELQAAASEEAILVSLSPQHSFPLESVFKFLHPDSARAVLTQALLAAPMFESRWRWNVQRSLMLERFQNGKRVPAALLRMRADDLLAASFPHVVACPENLPAGDLPVPMEHPIVRQTIEDCLYEAMDVEGFLDLLRALDAGTIETVAVDTPEPSAFAAGILAAHPYSFLDDAPLEERRTQAVLTRRGLDPQTADTLGALDPAGVQRVRQEVWPQPENAEEVHEALLWMGYATVEEARSWQAWIDELGAAGRVVRAGGCWFAAEASRQPKDVLRGRLEALGPVFENDPRIALPDDPRVALPEVVESSALLAAQANGVQGSALPARRDAADAKPSFALRGAGDAGDGREVNRLLLELEHEGSVMRTRLDGRPAWCDRRLLARIHRYTVERLRAEIEPATAAEFLRFLTCWQHVDEKHRLDGPQGVLEVVRQLAGFEIPAGVWESSVLPLRVRDYRREWLDELSLLGEVAWGRLWGSGATAIRATPISLLPRDELETWLSLSKPATAPGHPRPGGARTAPRAAVTSATPAQIDPSAGPRRLSAAARETLAALLARGPLFQGELQRATGLLPAHLEMGLAELIAAGLATCDSFAGLRQLVVPPSRRRVRVHAAGRWSLFRGSELELFRAAQAPMQRTAEHEPPALRVVQDPPDRFRSGAPAEFVAQQLLRRYGVIFARLLLRESLPAPWHELVRVYRRLELCGEVRGGRFVAGFAGEQFALPQAVELLRKVRRDGRGEREAAGARKPVFVDAADPLNLEGILTPAPRVARSTRARVAVG